MASFNPRKRRTSYRLKNWDYTWNASYFVTICTDQKLCYFGEIKDGQMHFSPIGSIADMLWHEIKNHAKNVELDNYVIMPNHIHGIITLNNNNHSVGTRHVSMAPCPYYENNENNKNKRKTIKILNQGFKTKVKTVYHRL